MPAPTPAVPMDVVTASVADAGQCVVLAADHDLRPGGPAAADERGGQIERWGFDGNAVAP